MLRPFFHGTDAKFMSLKEETRSGLRDICISLIEGLGEYMGYVYGYGEEGRKKLLHYDDNPKIYDDYIQAYCNYYEYINGCKDFEYPKDVIYLTQSPLLAIDYADKAYAFGEVGYIAYAFSKAAKILDPTWENKAADVIIDFAELPPQPVIVIIENLDKDKLFLEDGSEIKPFMWERLEQGIQFSGFRYKGDIKFDPQTTIICDENFRKWAKTQIH